MFIPEAAGTIKAAAHQAAEPSMCAICTYVITSWPRLGMYTLHAAVRLTVGYYCTLQHCHVNNSHSCCCLQWTSGHTSQHGTLIHCTTATTSVYHTHSIPVGCQQVSRCNSSSSSSSMYH